MELLSPENTLPAGFTGEGRCIVCGSPTEFLCELPFGGAKKYSTACPECEPKRRDALRKEEANERRRKFYGRLAALGMKKREYEYTFGNFVVSSRNIEAYRASREFALYGGGGVFLSAPGGAGKTHLACAALKVCLSRGKSVRFYQAVDLAEYLRSLCFDPSEISEQQAIERLAKVEVLFLDDLGAGKITDYARDALYRIIDRRYRAELPVFVTSNLDFDRLAKKIDDRVASRLAAMCEGGIVRYRDEDWRLKKRANAEACVGPHGALQAPLGAKQEEAAS